MGAWPDRKLLGFLLTTAVCSLLLHPSVAPARIVLPGGDSAATSHRLAAGHPPGEYNRQDWPHWIDVDRDCQNTRAEILIRDSSGPIKFKRNKPCNVSWGRWLCPYTGKEILKASELDIDHVVPLSHAQKSGAAAWSRARKRQFANDPLNLLAVEARANRAKGDQGPDRWRPPQRNFWPQYSARWRQVKNKYGLSISPTEEQALREMAAESVKPTQLARH